VPNRQGELTAAEIVKRKVSPSEIRARVETHSDETQALRDRQDSDLALWQLTDHSSDDTNDGKVDTVGDPISTYTSNEPRTYADKISGWLSTAKLLIRVPYREADRENRERQDAKERLVRGLIALGDERLVNRLEDTLQDYTASFGPVRGWGACRALLVNQEGEDGQTSTFVDIMPMDARHAFWGMGPNGLEWFCTVTERSFEEIEREYGKELTTHGVEGLAVYDYYDREINTTFAGEEILKAPILHGVENEVPWGLARSALSPKIGGEGEIDTSAGWGESIYAANRDVYRTKNEILSIQLELLRMQKDRAWKFFTDNGEGRLEERPDAPDAVHNLATNDKLELVDVPVTNQDAAVLFAVTAGEAQRGGLPYTVFGELQFQLSGFAVQTLNQTVDTRLNASRKLAENLIMQVGELLIKQYISNKFNTFEVRGFDNGNHYFNETIPADQVRDLPPITVKLVAGIPTDQAQQLALAEKMRQVDQYGFPLMDDVTIHDKILRTDDVDATLDAVTSQTAARMIPMARLYTSMRAAEERNQPNLAAIYWAEMMSLMKEMVQEGKTPVEEIKGEPPGAGSFDPRILPQAFIELPPDPFDQAGPLVPPGSERPGAQQGLLSRLLGAAGQRVGLPTRDFEGG